MNDSLFHILIGTFGSYTTLVHGAVMCDYILSFIFYLLIYKKEEDHNEAWVKEFQLEHMLCH